MYNINQIHQMNSNLDHFNYSLADPIPHDSESVLSESSIQQIIGTVAPIRSTKPVQSKPSNLNNSTPVPPQNNRGQNPTNANPYSTYQTANKTPLYSVKLNSTPVTRKGGIAEAFDSIKRPNEQDQPKSPVKQPQPALQPVVKVPIEISKSYAKPVAQAQPSQPITINTEKAKSSGQPPTKTQPSQSSPNTNPALNLTELQNEDLRRIYINLTKDFNDQVTENQRLRNENDALKRNVICYKINICFNINLGCKQSTARCFIS